MQLGTVKTRGFEFEATRAIADDLDVIATYSYTRAKDLAEVAGGRVTIDLLDSTPKHLALVGGMKSFAFGNARLRAGAGVRYVSDSFSTGSDGDAAFTLTTPGFVLADALLGVDVCRYRFSLSGTNLFGKEYLTTCLGRGDCYVGARRTVIGRVG